MDRISTSHRSWNMSRIPGSNTKPELKVRSILHRIGLRFRLHVESLPAKPDIVLPRFNTVIFVHGCFWHRHGCKFTYMPKSRADFWLEKFAKNKMRDSKNRRQLKSLGWRVLIVWECELRNPEKLEGRMRKAFCSML